jgi:hypothetical protein
MQTPHPPAWRKATSSNVGNGCVEVARDLGAVRDSKNPDGPRLRFDVRALIAVVKGRG